MKSSWTAYSVDQQSILPASLPKNSNGGAREDADITLLNGIAARLAAGVPPQEMLREVVEFVAALVQCDSCMIYVLEEEHLALRASKNPHPESVDRMKVGQGITGWVAQHREPVVVPRGAYLDPRFKLFNELPEDRFEA